MIKKVFLCLCLLSTVKWVHAADLKSTICGAAFSLEKEDNPEIISMTVRYPHWPYLGQGTGIFVGEKQTVATTLHSSSPLRKSREFEYFFEDPKTGKSVPLYPVAADLRNDLMLLRTPNHYQASSFYPRERLVKPDGIKGLEELFTLGFSRVQWSVSQGTISTYDLRKSGQENQYLAFITSGNVVQEGGSGTPVISTEGSIMGIITNGDKKINTIFFRPAWILEGLLDQSHQFSCRTTVCINEWKKWREFALQGDREAQFLLGHEAFNIGEHISGEYEDALYWLKQSAGQHYLPALNLLGDMFYKGLGVKQNTEQAKKYYREAADRGDGISQYDLGFIAFKEGDSQSMVKWNAEGARQGFPLSECEFGEMCRLGYGTRRDERAAETYLLRAARQGIAIAKWRLGRFYRIQGKFSLARQWFLEVEHLPEVKTEIARMIDEGKGFEKNPQEAMGLYQEAAEEGEPFAQYIVGTEYLRGIDEKQKNIQQGILYLKQSAEKRFVEASYNLGVFFIRNKDFAESATWFLKSAWAGFPLAQYDIGNMYREGKVGESKNPLLGEKWLLQSALRGYAPAMYELSEMYSKGEGPVLRDSEKSTYWQNLAQEQEYTPEDPRWHNSGEKNLETLKKLTPVSHL